MEIKITIKQFGKKHALLAEHPLIIDSKDSIMELQQLLLLIVARQVAVYQSKAIASDDEDTIHSPVHGYMNVLMNTGKAGFGNIYNGKMVDLDAAQQNVLQAFEDGVFIVFQGDDQLTSLSQSIDLSLHHSFTFLRLTFLAGSYW